MSTTELEDQIQSDEIPKIEITENIIVGFELLCRLCANRSDNLIPIYSEEGISNDLSNKMNLYLPIKVLETDTLPLQCCYQCASTVLTWHELVVASVEANRRLQELQIEAEKHLQAQNEALQQSLLEQVVETKSDSEDDRTDITTEADFLKPVSSDVVIRQEPVIRKRGRPAKCKTTNQDLITAALQVGEATITTTDGEWIKTEYILCKQEQQETFQVDCVMEEDTEKLELIQTEDISDENDFEALDPDFDPSEFDDDFHNCENCGSKFKTIKEFRVHLKECQIDEPVKNAVFKAEDLEEYDEAELPNEYDLNLEDSKGKKGEFQCVYCSFSSTKNDELKHHMSELHQDKLDHLVVTKRQRRSKIDKEAVNKAKVVVDSRTYYHCNICGKNLHSPYTYIWHNKIHTGERLFVCDLCGKQFRVSQGLVRHLRETHAGIKNFPCDLCGRMFSTRKNVEEHRRIHTNERPYICDICGKAFKQKASLFVHNKSHSNHFPFKCSYCNQGFRTRPPLLIHITRHTGEKPYPCDICGRCFRIKYELKRHRLIHSDEKPFSCTDCGLSFRQKRYLRNHNNVNHNKPTP